MLFTMLQPSCIPESDNNRLLTIVLNGPVCVLAMRKCYEHSSKSFLLLFVYMMLWQSRYVIKTADFETLNPKVKTAKCETKSKTISI